MAFNHVHHICNAYFSDGGGIYTLGISPGTAIRNKVVHDVVPTPLMPVGGCGIYLDEGSTGIVVKNNVVYNVGAAAFTQHYGRDNVVRNNVFAFAGRNPICCARPEEHLSYTFEGNVVLSGAGQATSDHYSPLKAKTEFRRNLYWDVSGKEPLFSGVSFAEWQRSGRDRDSRIADPQFRDAGRYDFGLKPTSPALAMGLGPIATDQVGLYGDAEWVSAPAKLKRQPLPKLPPPPAPTSAAAAGGGLRVFRPRQAAGEPELVALGPARRPPGHRRSRCWRQEVAEVHEDARAEVRLSAARLLHVRSLHAGQGPLCLRSAPGCEASGRVLRGPARLHGERAGVPGRPVDRHQGGRHGYRGREAAGQSAAGQVGAR